MDSIQDQVSVNNNATRKDGSRTEPLVNRIGMGDIPKLFPNNIAKQGSISADNDLLVQGVVGRPVAPRYGDGDIGFDRKEMIKKEGAEEKKVNPLLEPVRKALEKDDDKEARKQADALLEAQTKKHGKESKQVVDTLLDLGDLFQKNKKVDDAKRYDRQGLDMGRLVAGRHVETALADDKGLKKDSAEANCKAATEIYERLYDRFGARSLGDSSLKQMVDNYQEYSSLVAGRAHSQFKLQGFDPSTQRMADEYNEGKEGPLREQAARLRERAKVVAEVRYQLSR